VTLERAPAENIQQTLERLVRERVDQILSLRTEGELAPDFESGEVSSDARLRNNMFQRRKWSFYFGKFGCRVCERKDVVHAGTSHCQTCRTRICMRLRKIEQDFNKGNPESEFNRQIDILTSRTRTARELLGKG
jgi:hypothetical protein